MSGFSMERSWSCAIVQIRSEEACIIYCRKPVFQAFYSPSFITHPFAPSPVPLLTSKSAAAHQNPRPTPVFLFLRPQTKAQPTDYELLEKSLPNRALPLGFDQSIRAFPAEAPRMFLGNAAVTCEDNILTFVHELFTAPDRAIKSVIFSIF